VQCDAQRFLDHVTALENSRGPLAMARVNGDEGNAHRQMSCSILSQRRRAPSNTYTAFKSVMKPTLGRHLRERLDNGAVRKTDRRGSRFGAARVYLAVVYTDATSRSSVILASRCCPLSLARGRHDLRQLNRSGVHGVAFLPWPGAVRLTSRLGVHSLLCKGCDAVFVCRDLDQCVRQDVWWQPELGRPVWSALLRS
jgi:hypothetical protein